MASRKEQPSRCVLSSAAPLHRGDRTSTGRDITRRQANDRPRRVPKGRSLVTKQLQVYGSMIVPLLTENPRLRLMLKTHAGQLGENVHQTIRPAVPRLKDRRASFDRKVPPIVVLCDGEP
jgi:hypothetical protein